MSVYVIVFVVCVAACVVAHLAILLSVAGKPSSAPGAGVPRPRRAVEILWAILPAVALALVLTATWERVRDRPAPEPVLEVAR